jgi:riboflavin synthase
MGAVAKVVPGAMTELWIDAVPSDPYVRGESIAVNGCCLTVVDFTPTGFHTQASPETLRRTTLGSLASGARVNLERSLKMGDRLGGHWVQGHVDATTRLVARRPEGGSVVMAFDMPADHAAFFVEKGSVALDGVSLTLNGVEGKQFHVALIPETLARTTLGDRRVGDAINVEVDVIGKYVARMIGPRAGAGLSAQTLAAAGFGSEE